jgi:hypothetical protein
MFPPPRSGHPNQPCGADLPLSAPYGRAQWGADHASASCSPTALIPSSVFADRYRDLTDRRLAARLAAEDLAEENEELSPHERVTCRLHRRWAHHCVSSPQHAIAVTGHRWCRRCEVALNVAVDELAGTVALTCVRCRLPGSGVANRQVIRSCQASIATFRAAGDPLAAVRALAS